MPGVNVGEQGPSFRLPSAQGGEIGLEDFRDSKNVIVWFTKGMACMFCRAQMSQLARAYDDVRKLEDFFRPRVRATRASKSRSTSDYPLDPEWGAAAPMPRPSFSG